jgi:citrate synthase
VLDSAITRIDPARGPIYRARPAVDLANEGATFEDVANVLWQSERPPPWMPLAGGRARAPTLLSSFALSIVSLGLGDPTRAGASREAEIDRARGLIMRLAGAEGPGASVAETFLASLGRTRGGRRARAALDRALVLVADHELNASTFAARVAASAGADLYACLTAAIATLSGPRHGGESDRVEALLREVGSPARARAVILARTQRGELLPGFGHPLYPHGDPRAPPLLADARALAPGATRTISAVVDEVRRTLKLEPTLDVGLVAIAHSIGAPGVGSAIFALGRCAGWVAHVLEQREAGFLLRPRARYTGP